MIRSLSIVPAIICAAAIVATAQTPAQPQAPAPTPAPAQTPAQPPAPTPAPTPQKSTPPSMEMATGARVTYTGCVKPGTEPGTWILENADATPAKTAGATVGTSGVTKATLNLTTKAGTDLKPHANHKVEVIGTVSAAKLTMPSDPAKTADRQQVSVESVKMVSTTCP